MKYPTDGGGGTAGGDNTDTGVVDANNTPVTQDEINSALKSSGMVLPESTVTDQNLKADEGDDVDEGSDANDDGDDGSSSDGSDEGDGSATDEATAADDGTDKGEPPSDSDGDKATEDAPEARDFAFTVEDADGQSFTINADDSLDDVLAEFTPKNSGQMMEIVKQQMRLQDEKVAFEADQLADSEAEERNATIKAIQNGWDNEFKTLGIADEDRQKEIFAFMGEENDKRIAANRPTIASIEDAKNGLELREAKAQADQAEKDAKEAKRKNGALVGGSSAPATSGSPVYKAGSARNSTEALRAMGLL